MNEYDLQMFRDAQAAAAENIETELKQYPPPKGTRYIVMGKFKMDVWYQSPYPEDVARLPKLYICEFCLRYQKSEVSMVRHAAKCVWRHPPGDEIYRQGKLSVWQVDGKRHKQYCQHLCLLAKFFLDYKTLWTEVEPFLFYVMTLADSEGCHTVGYFSKVGGPRPWRTTRVGCGNIVAVISDAGFLITKFLIYYEVQVTILIVGKGGPQ